MIMFVIKLGVLSLVVAAAATGVTVDEQNVDSKVMQTVATVWNWTANTSHQFVEDNEEEIIAFSKSAAATTAFFVADVFIAIGNYFDEHDGAVGDKSLAKLDEPFSEFFTAGQSTQPL